MKALVGKHEVCQPLVANMETTELRNDICPLYFQPQFKTFSSDRNAMIFVHCPWSAAQRKAVFRIRDILVWIRILGSLLLTNGSGSGSGSQKLPDPVPEHGWKALSIMSLEDCVKNAFIKWWLLSHKILYSVYHSRYNKILIPIKIQSWVNACFISDKQTRIHLKMFRIW